MAKLTRANIQALLFVAAVTALPLMMIFFWSPLEATLLKDRVPSYHGFNSANPFSSRAEKIDVGFKDDMPFIWIATYRFVRGFKNINERIDIIDPIERKRVFLLDDEDLNSPGFSVKDFARHGDFFVIPSKDDLQCRAADGELLENSETLRKKIPELSAGIGKVEKNIVENNFRVITKDGFQYRYFPEKKVLLTEDAFRQKIKKTYSDNEPIDTTDKDYELRYMWGLSKENESVRKKLYLTKKYHSALSPNFNSATLERLEHDAKYNAGKDKENRGLRDEQLVMIASEVFLNGGILASNPHHCVVLHNQTIEKDAEQILTCVNHEGKVLWQLVAPKLKTFEYADYNNMSGLIHKNTVAIINNNSRNRATCGLDIQTGKLLWEFEAF